MQKAFGHLLSYGYGARHRMRNLVIAVLLSAGGAQAQTVTIAALGDSLTAGYGLQQSAGFVPQMQAWLDANGADVRLINAGVSGDTTAGGRSRVDWTLTPDVDAMMIALGGNDYLRGIDPAVSRQNLDAILAGGEGVAVPMLLVGIKVGGNYGAAYKEAFDGMYPALAESYDVPLYPDFFGGLRTVGRTQAELAPYFQADGLHPNARGVAVIVADMGPAIIELAELARARAQD